MHLGNGAITAECGVVALGVAAAGAGAAWLATRSLAPDRMRALGAAALGATIFAAQLFNVQILPFSSAHLVGGVLLAWLLGPAIGILAMAAILATQAVLLGDGGLLALGVNLLNMGILPAFGVWLLRRSSAKSRREAASDRPAALTLKTAFALGATAFVCTLAGAAAIVGEVAIGRSGAELAGWSQFAMAMLASHAVAGLLEATLTVALAAVLAQAAVRGAEKNELAWRLSPRMAGGLLAVSLVVALLSLPTVGLASAEPDGYESALVQVTSAGGALGRIESDRELKGLAAMAESWQQNTQSCEARLLSHMLAPRAILCGLATLVAATFVGSLSRLRPPPGREPTSQEPTNRDRRGLLGVGLDQIAETFFKKMGLSSSSPPEDKKVSLA